MEFALKMKVVMKWGDLRYAIAIIYSIPRENKTIVHMHTTVPAGSAPTSYRQQQERQSRKQLSQG